MGILKGKLDNSVINKAKTEVYYDEALGEYKERRNSFTSRNWITMISQNYFKKFNKMNELWGKSFFLLDREHTFFIHGFDFLHEGKLGFVALKFHCCGDDFFLLEGFGL